mmetsp:Transcript_71691/g.213991  ORF Transcript_71691/g.213991 Transcript_71691/m.213991 type:complete len:206 (-) Transcript_71691:755-1372(-)
MLRMMEWRSPSSPARVDSTSSSTSFSMVFLHCSYFFRSCAWAPKPGTNRFAPNSVFALMVPVTNPRPKRKLSMKGCGGLPAPIRSTFCMSRPMLQATTASAVMEVSQSLTPSILCPAENLDHSRTNARVLSRICGAKLLTLIWLKPRGSTLCPDCQSSLVSLLVKRPLPVKSDMAFCCGRFQSLGNSAARDNSSSTTQGSAVQVR